MRNRPNMRPQDILVALKLVALGGKPYQSKDLASALHISPAEVSEALERLKRARLIDREKRFVLVENLLEFKVHGLKYVFPVEPGTLLRGIPTSHSSPVLSKRITSSPDDVYVWPSGEGTVRGICIEPLYKTVPQIALEDKELYDLLALIDAIRIGKTRERKLAINELEKRFKNA